jgi:hypothetical protein
MTDMRAFDKDTLYRMTVEAARFWVVEHFLRTRQIPDKPRVMFVYPSGCEACMDFGNAPGPDGPDKPMRGRRVRVTFEIEEG